MASLTGRTWLDCNNPKLADDFFSLAVNVSVILEAMCTFSVKKCSDVASCIRDANNSEHCDVVMFV